jgi:hypothetical protein
MGKLSLEGFSQTLYIIPLNPSRTRASCQLKIRGKVLSASSVICRSLSRAHPLSEPDMQPETLKQGI